MVGPGLHGGPWLVWWALVCTLGALVCAVGPGLYGEPRFVKRALFVRWGSGLYVRP